MTSDPLNINAQASALMKQGIRLMNDPRAGAVSEALLCFDRALELRRRLPLDASPLYRYGLAACLLNQADALTRLGGPDQLSAAIRSYDEAIAVLGGLTLSEDARFPRRLAMAHANRGLALQLQTRVADAMAAFGDASAVLEHPDAASIPDLQYLRAALCMNLANAQAAAATTESLSAARVSALRAIELVGGLEATDAEAAEVSLKARHVLCRTVAHRLSPSHGDAMSDDVHEATDLADEGLALVRQWEQRGTVRFRAVACDLFRFGALVYATFQPHFLSEFIAENMDPAHSSPDYVGSDEMRAAAAEALAFGVREGD